jgi:hypothetical protein
VIALLGSLVVLFADASAVSGAPEPYQIYARAVAMWASQQYPPYVGYTIAITVDENGVQKANHYSATYDALHDRTYVEAVSEEEASDPHVPTGVNMSIDPKRRFGTLFHKRVGRPDEAVDYLGVPLLAPNYSFGMSRYVPADVASDADRLALVEQVRRAFNDPMPAQKAQQLDASDNPKEIARVVATNRDYDITNDGIETVDGRQTYHLSLRPEHPSGKLRLREMWIDTQTFATRRLLTEVNFIDGKVPWLVTFADVGGAQYISSEVAQRPVGSGPHLYQQAEITFTNIVPTQPQPYRLNAPLPSADILTEPP